MDTYIDADIEMTTDTDKDIWKLAGTEIGTRTRTRAGTWKRRGIWKETRTGQGHGQEHGEGQGQGHGNGEGYGKRQ